MGARLQWRSGTRPCWRLWSAKGCGAWISAAGYNGTAVPKLDAAARVDGNALAPRDRAAPAELGPRIVCRASQAQRARIAGARAALQALHGSYPGIANQPDRDPARLVAPAAAGVVAAA